MLEFNSAKAWIWNVFGVHSKETVDNLRARRHHESFLHISRVQTIFSIHLSNNNNNNIKITVGYFSVSFSFSILFGRGFASLICVHSMCTEREIKRPKSMKPASFHCMHPEWKTHLIMGPKPNKHIFRFSFPKPCAFIAFRGSIYFGPFFFAASFSVSHRTFYVFWVFRAPLPQNENERNEQDTATNKNWYECVVSRWNLWVDFVGDFEKWAVW